MTYGELAKIVNYRVARPPGVNELPSSEDADFRPVCSINSTGGVLRILKSRPDQLSRQTWPQAAGMCSGAVPRRRFETADLVA
jgi:hypothetical protein